MPNRFVLLSSALEANGSAAESCAALAVAAWCSIEGMASSPASAEGEGDEGGCVSEDILLFPENEILDARPRDGDATGGLSPIINRLTRSYIECRKSARLSGAGPTNSLSKILENTLMGKVLGVACSSANGDDSSAAEPMRNIRLSKLLHAAVWSKKRYETELSISQIAAIVREILRSTIKVTKSNHSDELAAHVIAELKLFLQAQKNRLTDIADPELQQILSSSFHVSFAARAVDSCLLRFPRPSFWASRKSTVEDRERQWLRCARTQLRLAEAPFTARADGRGVGDACFFAQWAAVRFHRALLSEHLSLAELCRESAGDEESGGAVAKRIPRAGTEYEAALSTCM